uniref:helix-turn-helix domain-containing protein n=1 Tax=Candidatus Enterococcus willemsii TaxID=1857215 RepID=UPI00403F9948
MVFGFSKEVCIKKKMLSVFDNVSGEFDIEDLTQVMGIRTSQTVRKYLNEIEELIATYYSPKELNLEVGKRGDIRLHRNGANLDKLLEVLYTEDLVYKIYQKLILTRVFSTEDFCKQQQISISTLRRTITRMNHSLLNYDVSIKVGKKVSIVGDEAQIRFLFFEMLYFVHHSSSTIKWFDMKNYHQLSQQVCQAFYITPELEQRNILSMWLFINQQSEDLDKGLAKDYFEENYENYLPNELFSSNTWKYILLVMYALDFFNFEPELTFERMHQHQFSEITNQWMLLFEKYIHTLSSEEKASLILTMYKYELFHRILPNYREATFNFNPTNEETIKDDYPYFYLTLNRMWNELASHSSLSIPKIVKDLLFSCTFQLASPEDLFPVVRCYLYSSLPQRNQQQLEKMIQYQLLSTAKIIFVTEESHADILFTTNASREGNLISVPLVEKDYIYIKNIIYAWIQKNED